MPSKPRGKKTSGEASAKAKKPAAAKKKSAAVKAKPGSKPAAKKKTAQKKAANGIAKASSGVAKKRNGAADVEKEAVCGRSNEEIAVAAYYLYEKRIGGGESADEVADWHAARCELAAGS